MKLQVEKKLLEPPKPKHENSPPPKKLTSITTNAGVNVLKAKKIRNPSNNQNLTAKSKSTNDVSKRKEVESKKYLTQARPPPPPPPPVNLLNTQRPPLEIHKIEGDKIIIIRRVPRAQRLPADCEHRSLRTLPTASLKQVTKPLRFGVNLSIHCITNLDFRNSNILFSVIHLICYTSCPVKSIWCNKNIFVCCAVFSFAESHFHL